MRTFGQKTEGFLPKKIRQHASDERPNRSIRQEPPMTRGRSRRGAWILGVRDVGISLTGAIMVGERLA
ncbi:MAG: hypothetical protein EBT19_01385 [Methylocystaceae bacterium]|nr:hypothetical protein [Methylocystaceae bacterium]